MDKAARKKQAGKKAIEEQAPKRTAPNFPLFGLALNGQRYEGVLSLQELARLSVFKGPIP